MTPVVLSDRARLDLEEIWADIALVPPEVADRVLLRLEAACRGLGAFPESGRVRRSGGVTVRSVPCQSWVILYRVAQAGVEVLRVVHAARDVDRLL